jgi:hypothetical protein
MAVYTVQFTPSADQQEKPGHTPGNVGRELVASVFDRVDALSIAFEGSHFQSPLLA